MEFYIVDPKDLSFSDWSQKIKELLESEKLEYTAIPGGLSFINDDVAEPWNEESLLFKVTDERSKGEIELRAEDNHFYIVSDDLTIFENSDFKDVIGYRPHRAGAVFGFEFLSQKGCRFHSGPSKGACFLCDPDEDFPPQLELPAIWNLLIKCIYWIASNINRVQDIKKITSDKLMLDFDVDVSFTHPASLDALSELLKEDDGYDAKRTSLRATFKEREISFIREFANLLPQDPESYDRASFKAVWRCEDINGKKHELFHIGIERRNLRPFVQIPLQASDKKLVELIRNNFKGHRIDKQEHFAN